MRKLTILRRKSFAASLAKMKVYLEDPFSDEIKIRDVPCRKLGDLKNGEEATFQIENKAAKVFVIGDKLSKDFCGEYYQLPEGEEDIHLSGANTIDLAGNAFLFDGNDEAVIKETRKKGKLAGRIILILALTGGIVLGRVAYKALFSGNAKEKVFTTEGMSITLTNEFRKVDSEGYTAAFASRSAAVMALKEPFSLVDGFGDLTLDEYLDLVLEANNGRGTIRTNLGGMDCIRFDNTNPETSDTYTYIAFPYKSDDAFWLIQFATLAKDSEKYSKQITDWAKSVTFK